MNSMYLLKAYVSHIRWVTLNKLPKHPVLRENIKYKDIHNGERCFILGSGHSILKQDLTKLRDEIVITQNHFHAHPDIDVIQPQYHCVVPMYQPPEYNNDWIRWFESMEDKLPIHTIFFLGLNSKELVEENELFVNRRSYINHGLNPMFMRRPAIDITRIITGIPTVITQCLTVALYMGFDKIYLLGFDLDQPCRNVDRKRGRFYGSSPITANEAENRIEQELDRTGEGWFNRWVLWKQFRLLREEAERNGAEIINLTEGGLLDCFERQAYDSMVL